MSELLPPNWTTGEYALAAETERISNIPVPIRQAWNPQACPSSLLPWLAWAFAVDGWDSNWTDTQKRQAIVNSVYLHQHKGTVGSVRRLMDALGVGYVLQEWWQTNIATDAGDTLVTDSGFSLGVIPAATPYTAAITIADTNVSLAAQQGLIAAINRVKPVRTLITVNFTSGFDGSVNVCGGFRVTRFDRLQFAAPYSAQLGTDSGNTLVTDSGDILVS